MTFGELQSNFTLELDESDVSCTGLRSFTFDEELRPYESITKGSVGKQDAIQILDWKIKYGELRGTVKKVRVSFKYEESDTNDNSWLELYHETWFLARCKMTRWNLQVRSVIECCEEKIREWNNSVEIEKQIAVLRQQEEEQNVRRRKKKRRIIPRDSNSYRFRDIGMSPLVLEVDTYGNWTINIQLYLTCIINSWNKFAVETNKLLGDLFLEKNRHHFMNHEIKGYKIQNEFNRQTVAYSKTILDAGVDLPSVPELNVQMMPFQKESVHWMLRREHYFGTSLKKAKSTKELTKFLNEFISYGYEYMTICECFWNKFTGYILPIQEAWNIYEEWISDEGNLRRGRGVLAEEMGLGKTIEVLALITINKRDLSKEKDDTFLSPINGKWIKRVKTNLIVCPESILQQWIDEISIHVNERNKDFRVFHYTGFVKMREKYSFKKSEEIVQVLSEFDVVICSYSTLSNEVHYAEFSKNQRPSRNTTRKYDYTSPLSIMEFYRVILDEVQYSSSASSNISRCANLLHRIHTWGVSGTPISWNSDLQNVLTYLQFHPFQTITNISSCILRNKVQKERYLENRSNLYEHHLNVRPEEEWNGFRGCEYTIDDLLNIFTEYDLVIRHSKEDVKNQINIPNQINYMIPVEFNPIEQDHYLNLWHSFLDVSGYDIMGNGECRMRLPELNHWLYLLRLTCCHASIAESGSENATSQAWRETAELKDMDAILSGMKDEVIDSIRALQRENFSLKIQAGQVLMEMELQFEPACNIFKDVIKNLTGDLKEFYNLEDVFHINAHYESVHHKDVINIRHLMQLLHQAYFFLATSYYHMGSRKLEKIDEENQAKPELKKEYSEIHSSAELEQIEIFQELERKNYSLAEVLRREMLHERILDVDVEIEKVKQWFLNENNGKKYLGYIELEKDHFLTILSGNYIFQGIMKLLNSINEQSIQFNKLVDELEALSYKSIVKEYEGDKDEEKAKEYEQSISDQDKVFSMLDVLEKLLQNREEMFCSEVNVLPFDANIEKIDVASEFHQQLIDSLKMTSGQSLKMWLNEAENNTALRSQIMSNKEFSATPDQFINLYEREITRIMRENSSIRVVLKKFNDIYNAKTNYYSYLQRISDSLVSLVQLSKTGRTQILKNTKGDVLFRENQRKINNLQARVRYLDTLRQLKDAINRGEHITCLICYTGISTGSIIKCGHYFCKDCIVHWLSKNHSCPLCKTKMLPSDVYHFKFREEDPEIKASSDEENETLLHNGNSSAESEMIITDKYTKFQNLNQVNSIELKNSWGGKIDQVIKMILFIKRQHLEHEPHKRNPQIVIYSHHTSFLDILAKVMTIHDIRFARPIRNTKFATAVNNFKKEPRCTCLLLSVHSQATGLTLINAKHVFILEPILNEATELQAISRVHRIGQKEETSVWNFMVRNTVEENIMKYKSVLDGRKNELRKRVEMEGDNEHLENLIEQCNITPASMDVEGQKKHLWHCFFENAT